MKTAFTQLLQALPAKLRAGVDPAYAVCGEASLASLLSRGERPGGAAGSGEAGAVRHRWQDAVIEQMVPVGASVLDLGCGNGHLLGRLIRDKGVRGQGVEVDFEAVLACIDQGIPVYHADLDQGLSGFQDASFDYVILEETVQTLHRPLKVLKEMLRVGGRGLVSFPNFGCWNVRLSLAVKGRMPVTEELPHAWYNTPNIHLLTLEDFHCWAAEHQVRITGGYAFLEGEARPLDYPSDNLLAEEVLLAIEPAPPGGD